MANKIAALICAAGSSSRFKGKRKKQFTDLDGRAVFLRSLEAFADRDDVVQTVVAIPPDEEEMFKIKWGANLSFFGAQLVLGGANRDDTTEKLLAAVRDDVELVALHDAVRPCVTQKMLDEVFAAAAEHGAAILASPLVGTIKRADDAGRIAETIDRSRLWEAQTPQVFRVELIRRAYAQRRQVSGPITDDAQLVEELGEPVKLVASDAGNIKITTGADLAIASAILKSRPKPKPSGPAGPWAAEAMWDG